ncbi:MAG TPA: hypothetical protein VD835_20810 [Pyrinomonadaceae bacterium]|nr:hypothetical protein [Pyrinomonadaceae bacterium]
MFNAKGGKRKRRTPGGDYGRRGDIRRKLFDKSDFGRRIETLGTRRGQAGAGGKF